MSAICPQIAQINADKTLTILFVKSLVLYGYSNQL